MMKSTDQRNEPTSAATKSNAIEIPRITLPKGGGALKGIDEKFQINAVNGTASFNIPLPLTPGRNGFNPALSLSYNSGSGNSLFGLGWDVGFPSIQLKTDKRLPRYRKGSEAEDTFTLSGEDLVPFLDKVSDWAPVENNVGQYFVRQYRPRIESDFYRIERINLRDSTSFYWKVTTKENVVTFFGVRDSHRIADPSDATKIFKWLPEFSFDDKGNLMQFIFKQEDLANVKNELHERNRFNELSKFTNRHIKSVRYGNRTPYFPKYTIDPTNTDEIFNPTLPTDQQYFFELVFDYGEHGANLITETTANGEVKQWNARTDPFSEYRPGFEMRTYRLCERILMFHHFDELVADYGEKTCLVKSLDLKFQHKGTSNDQPLEVTYLKSLTQKGYVRNKTEGKYKVSALPPIVFDYNELTWNTEIKAVSPENIVNAPVGLSADYQWVDLYNEGISGILTDQADGWYYKSNLGGGEFSVAKAVTQKPSFSAISNGTVQLQDIEANGKRQAVLLTGDVKGYFELSDDEQWQPFRMFDQVITRDLRDDNTRFIDLNGDGMPELVVSEDLAFVWYPAKGISGYDEAAYASKPFDEEQGPAIVFADSTESIFLADMSGDGLTDIVRIRNGDTCYWPNLGYGKFGARIRMTNAPVFDAPDQFNPAYLRLADVSGTGATDMLYLGKNRFKAWLNLSGNAWTAPCDIDPFPETSVPNHIAVVDLLGNGTSSIVWSSMLPANANTPMQYIDLMGGRKPHLMVRHRNSMGKETIVTYRSSAEFYLADKKAGKPWATKLPFPVHCVSKLEVIDTVTEIRFATKYTYHHGYYDHEEREFRGFGMVEQTDTEDYAYLEGVNAANATAPAFHEPPTLTKTWFHTGAYLRHKKLLDHFRTEYWYQDKSVLDKLALSGIAPASIEWQLPELEFVGSFSTSELIEAHRACKGMMLRQEIFSLDKSDREKLPYSVSTHNCHITTLQPRKTNRHAVFLRLESQSISYSYERKITDARIAHHLNLEIDEFGNVLKSVSVVYPRANDAIIGSVNALDISLQGHSGLFSESQGKEHILYTENRVTSDAKEKINGIDLSYYRLPVSWSVKTHEVGGVVKSENFYRISDFDRITTEDNVNFVGYHEKIPAENGVVHLRLIEETQTLFLAHDLTKALDAGRHGALGITYESYQLACTPELVEFLYNTDQDGNIINPKRVTDAELLKGKFCHLSPLDRNWWIRSGTMQYIDPLLAETNANAAQRFYMPLSYTDPFGSVTRVKYYKDYCLLMQETADALDNTTRIETFDFRTLSPRKVKDNNDNMVEVAMDALGFLAGTAVMGKGNEGDNLLGFVADLPAEQVQDFLADPFGNARDLLQHATMRLVYDLTRVPCVVGTILREEHHAVNPNPKLQYSFEYSGGLGNVVLKKIQAEPGDAPYRDADGKLVKRPDGVLDLKPAARRWVGNGRTILNNKGKPVKQYEPYFSDSHDFEDEAEVRETGVTPILYYDAAGRLIRTEMPDDTFTSMVYDSWMQRSFDQNDNTKASKWYTDRINGSIDALLLKQGRDPVREREAAEKAAIHDQTPSASHTDLFGRPFFVVEHNKLNDFTNNTVKEEFHATQFILDVEGNIESVIDPRGNTVAKYRYDMLGHQIYEKSMEGGARWVLNDCLGAPMFSWDSRDHRFETSYDALHRPVQRIVINLPASTGSVFERFQYMDIKGLAPPEAQTNRAANLLGKMHMHYDSSGITRSVRFDFKGNIAETSRQLCHDYKTVPDWTTPGTIVMESEVFVSRSEYDALNRVVKVVTPHTTAIPASILSVEYNEANLLNALSAKLRGGNADTVFVENVDYDVKGSRTSVLYGNNTSTKYTYDPRTFRLLRLRTTRNAGADKLQDLHYTYDPAGNITFIKDDALQSIFFNNQRVDPDCDYTYDSLYRLIQAKGREHIASNVAPDAYDSQRTMLGHKGDGNKLQRYIQRYGYDSAGNMLWMKNVNSWGRTFTYDTANNQLRTAPVDGVSGTAFQYTYDTHGNMTRMPHLPAMAWDFMDQLQHIAITASAANDSAVGAYYVYDSAGERARKVVEKNNVTEERIYLGGFEIFRKRRNGVLELERETLHVMDDTRRIAMVDTKLNSSHQAETPLIRYQYTNHLGTASLELDGTVNASIISYEEYYPYGSTSYQATDQLREIPAKRYRYTGKERDEESGLEYHGARYYAPWLGRWISCDPIGLEDGLNVYFYAGANPVVGSDPLGTEVITIGEVTVVGRRQDQIAQDIQAKTGVRAYEIAKAIGIKPDTSPSSMWVSDVEDKLESSGVILPEEGTNSQQSNTPEAPKKVSEFRAGGGPEPGSMRIETPNGSGITLDPSTAEQFRGLSKGLEGISPGKDSGVSVIEYKEGEEDPAGLTQDEVTARIAAAKVLTDAGIELPEALEPYKPLENDEKPKPIILGGIAILAPIFGKAQKTPTPGHDTKSQVIADEFRADPDVESVHLNRSWRRVTNRMFPSTRRPDVTVKFKDGEYFPIEVMSPTDTLMARSGEAGSADRALINRTLKNAPKTPQQERYGAVTNVRGAELNKLMRRFGVQGRVQWRR